MRFYILIILLVGVTTLAGCATDRPVTQTVDLGQVPPELLRAVAAGYPGAEIDRAESEQGQAATGYRVYFHVGHSRYWADFFKYRDR